MFWRKPPPPPPPPKIPQWAAISVPLIFAIIMGLTGLVWNSLAEEVKKLDEEKASRETIQQMLKNQETLIKDNKEDGEKRDAAIIETRKELIETRRELIKVQMQAPKNFQVKDAEVKKKALPPDFFEKYMKLSPEVQAKYKKYLESRGYDTEGL